MKKRFLAEKKMRGNEFFKNCKINFEIDEKE